MTDQLRDKIAEIVSDSECRVSGYIYPYGVADAILSALPGWVVPLVWDTHPDDGEWYTITNNGVFGPEMGYTITLTIKGNYKLTDRETGYRYSKHRSLEAAKDAANAHRVAQTIAALGIKA